MNMKIVMAAAWLGLLMWAEPAGAAATRTFSLTFGHHKSLKLTDAQADAILAEASKFLKQCDVVLERKGPVSTFESTSTPASVKKAADRDAINRENFDIKVVKQWIRFCRVKQKHTGCAWDPPPPPAAEVPQRKSIIVLSLPSAKAAGMILAHEFGHRTGLPHQTDPKQLMACEVPVDRAHPGINEHECKCFRGGPGSCDDPIEVAQKCSSSR